MSFGFSHGHPVRQQGVSKALALALSPLFVIVGLNAVPRASAAADGAGTPHPKQLENSSSTTSALSAESSAEATLAAAPSSAIIGNGTVQLGVNPMGNLIAPGGSPSSGSATTEVGLRYVPQNADALSPGCDCEGWGVADATSGVRGYANVSTGTDNVTVERFDATTTNAVSVVNIGSTFRVTHDLRPSRLTRHLYEVGVTIANVGSTAADLRYRRVMDWDVEPTYFDEFVTIGGSSARLAFSSNDGFASANPLAGATNLGSTGTFSDAGPKDHGALLDFSFGALAPGGTRRFLLFFGAAGGEQPALSALAAVRAQVYSLGQPNTTTGATQGTPNTFAFGFADRHLGSLPVGQIGGALSNALRLHAPSPTKLRADPVNTANGAFVDTRDDATLPGVGLPFAFARSYSSADRTTGPLGVGWTHAYNASLIVQPSGDVTFRSEDGQQILYSRRPDGSFGNDSGATSTLAGVADGYQLVRKDQVTYRFDTAGRLVSLRDRSGQGPTLAYGTAGTLDTITDSVGRIISLSYDTSKHLTRLALPDGRFVTYGYTADLLTSFTDLRGRTTNYR